MKRYLFFFVHPSKFHVFKHTINYLKSKGHQVDIVITKKDVLEDLVKTEGWDYKNIFPKGRKYKYLPTYVSAAINFFITIFKLFIITLNKKYDLFITDDLLVYLSKLTKTPSVVINDDDLSVVKQYSLVLSQASYCLSPKITDIGKYSHKKIGFDGYKELAYLHPKYFTPDYSVVREFNADESRYFILRLVLLKAYHDTGRKGLSNENVLSLIKHLEAYGKVFITAERQLPPEFEKYRINLHPAKIAHALYYADMYIGDSQTMSSEAAVLGVPTFRINDFAGQISVMEEKETRYKLSYNYHSSQFNEMLEDIQNLLRQGNYKQVFAERRNQMLKEKVDLTAFMIWLFENFPQSIEEYFKDSNINQIFIDD